MTSGWRRESLAADTPTSYSDHILSVIPNNIVRPFLEGNALTLILLAFVIGIGISRMPESERKDVLVKGLQGLQSYLRKYAYGNATWDDLVGELDQVRPEHNAQSFSDVWVKQKGLPTINCERQQDGSIIVDTHDSSKVWILLDGVEINCSDDACIQVDQADKVFLTLAEGSENTLISGSAYSDTALSDGTDGAIFAHDDLTINGGGSLTVTAQYSHGISANDDLVITGGTITISAVDDAIHVNDSIRIKDAAIAATAGDDGLLTTNEVENGYLYIESGTLDITASGDGIHTTGDITVAGGETNISAGDDGIHSDASVYVQSGTILISDCYEGIEALIIDVSGGDVSINCEDDGFNANGGSSDMFGGGGQMGGGQNDGTFGHGGMHGSGTDEGTTGEMPTPPDMGTEGMSSEMPTPPDMRGESMSGEMPAGQETDAASGSGQSSADTEDVETYIAVSGGTVRIVNEVGQDADGMDSNGDIKISGGTIYISLLGTGSNCAVDYASESGGVAEITGGTIIACGASSMAEGFDSTSTQASILYNTSTVAEAGTTLTVTDADGSVLLSWEVPCSFSSALISCPEMKVGGTYTVSAGGTSEEVTLESVSTTYGEAQGGMPGGDMGQSGMPGGGMRPDGQR